MPGWYVNGKFGIFIHWGVYSVPAFGNEWYPRGMYCQGTPEFEHHRATYGPHKDFGYKDLIPHFKAEHFEPAAWAELFRQAGARYVVPVAEHHDGFAMYDCGLSDWNALRLGPRRDIIGELARATRQAGLVFGLSSHRAEHWWFFDEGMKFDSDVRDSGNASLYGPARPKDTPPDEAFLNDWLARTLELVDKYQPQLLWFDWWIEQPAFKPYLRRLAADYYNRGVQWGQEVAINYKNDAFVPGTAVFDLERGQMAGIAPRFWQNDTAVGRNSWGYVRQMEYKTSQKLIGDLVDVVSKNGALLLNIGPRPDGTIPEQDQRLLREIGQWLAVNGEAIYDTRPWAVFGEGPTEVLEGGFTDTKREDFTAQDFRFTTRGQNLLYAICLGPAPREIVIQSLGTNLRLYTDAIAQVALVGDETPLTWKREPTGLKVTLPSASTGRFAPVLRITRKS